MRPFGLGKTAVYGVGALALCLVALGPETIPSRIATFNRNSDTYIGHPFLGLSQSAAGALAYFDEEEDLFYTEPLYEEESSDISWMYTEPIEDGRVYYQSDQFYTEPLYIDEPDYGVSYGWGVYEELPADADIVVFPSDSYIEIPEYIEVVAPYEIYTEPYDAYGYDEVYIIEEKPWYVQALPGIGQTLSYILPPIMRGTSETRPVVSPRPSCTIGADPVRVAFGGSTVLRWSSQNASRATLTNIGDVSSNGSRQENGLTISRMYTLSVTGPGGSNNCSVTVQVDPAAAQKPTCIISTNPSIITRGQSASLAWMSERATSAYLSGTGAVPLSGGFSVTPQQSGSYTLTVHSAGGVSNACSASISVR